ncbi:MAG: sigma-70 family RNA polymerase sigma factor [Chitinophagales bacterium]|nr:sigma-70 family RNA polymerase sigma factor [Chitinophagales bacterium]
MTFLTSSHTTTESDAELVLQFKREGDLKILGKLYERYLDLVYGVCLKYLKDPEAAKDAVMQLFEELPAKVKKHEVANFRGWLYQVARNQCLMALRSPKNLKIIDLDPSLMQNSENGHLNSVMEKEADLMKMEDCLETLPPDQQQMIRLFYLEGKCYKEIVGLTGIEWNRVRSHIQNGRRNLKSCMESQSF